MRVSGAPQINIDLGERIFELREQKGWSQVKLAEKANISRTTLSSLEKNSGQKPTLTTLRRLARAFGISLETMLRERPIVLGRKTEKAAEVA